MRGTLTRWCCHPDCKDLGIALQEARRNGSPLPVAALVDQLYQRVQARGGSRWDTSSLIQLLAAP
jgi:3-hydroxyisobutyrate dehydrogenase